MAQTGSMRVVPSGKIYRQMFEAQVQLNRSLTKIKTEDTKSLEREGTTIPLVRLPKDEVEHGLLTERQKTWVDGFPNDPYVENPVCYKQYAEYVNTTIRESDGSLAGKEVRGLPDSVVPAKTGSDIIEKIAASRKERHEAAVEDMQQELSVINSDLEPRITEASELLLERLAGDDEEINRMMATIEKDESLIEFTLDDLVKLWKDIMAHSESRQEWIKELDDMVKRLEDNRMELIQEVFRSYSKTLETISHLMTPDLHKFMDKESQLVNQTMLSNRRAYADLHVRLMSSDIEREKAQHTIWKRRIEDWRKLKVELAKTEFSDFMQKEAVVNPVEVQKVVQFMVAEQEILNNKRIELVNQLSELKPPASTKTAVYTWNKNMQAISDEINGVNQMHMSQLHGEYEKVCQTCLKKIDTIKNTLIESGVCHATRAQQVVEESMIPLVGERQHIFEETLESMEKSIETHNLKMGDELKSLFKYAQGAAHVWDVHEIGLAKQERALQEKLEQCRHQHDNQNQDKEANLDIIMDRMRQDASETALGESLKKALDMLEKIRQAYEIFHREQTEIVKQYPNMVMQELTGYDESVCKFFMVDRTNPEVSGKYTPRKWTSQKKQQKDKSGRESKDLPSAVGEILNTAKGTTFYVLTVAGEHGIPPEKEGKVVEKEAGGSTFLTEVETEGSGLPNYIQSIIVPDSTLIDVKKRLRMNFLDHLEEWTDQASERSSSVVIAKTEELNSELDLRLHLHKPRSRRAELDVHNVRAAELVMHSERVTRHCKGIQQALTELRARFNKMTQEHNDLAVKFREDIEALEVVFINATKSSRLDSLRNQLSIELDKFMSVIRASLRQFRQHLDETLQMLRESNARFIKSFKVFSDGGNFCPEEIDEYRKRLEKMSQKIDTAEGSIMSDLEGMESKRLEQATKVAMEFEDRFKSHMIDLLFMEKIARWLTNTQVKIKAEVAHSNSQAQQLAASLKELEKQIDACERPNLDKEQITAKNVNECLKAIFPRFHERSQYLSCLKDPTPRPSSATMQGNPALGARVGFTADTASISISKAGKQPTEDPSVGVIKSILKTQKSKLRFGIDADLDGEGPTDRQTALELREKMKSSMSNNTQSDKSKQGGRRGTETRTGIDQPKRVQSALRRSSKSAKFDKKYLIFGDKDEEQQEEPPTHFQGLIRTTLREALDGLLTSAEMYYRTKGSRPVTRPQALQETFEACADVIVQKLQSYHVQADEYHNQCLQEFRWQLNQLEYSTSHIPPLIVMQVNTQQIKALRAARKGVEHQFSSNLRQLENRQQEHQNLLRPTLGHPHQENELSALCQKETERHEEYLASVEKRTRSLQESVAAHAKEFLEEMAQTAESQLLQYDNLLVVDDVDKGRVEAKRYPTSELIRRKNAGQPLEDEDDKNALPRGKNTWTGLPNNELIVPGLYPPEKEKPTRRGQKEQPKATVTASVTTAKTTLGHSATMKARDQAFQDYKKEFEKTLQQIEEEKQKLLHAEQRWVDSWETSIEKVKQLY